MKAIAIVLGVLFLLGLFSIKAAVAVAFLGTCTAICLWINAKVKVPGPKRRRVKVYEPNIIESYDGNFDEEPLY